MTGAPLSCWVSGLLGGRKGEKASRAAAAIMLTGVRRQPFDPVNATPERCMSVNHRSMHSIFYMLPRIMYACANPCALHLLSRQTYAAQHLRFLQPKAGKVDKK